MLSYLLLLACVTLSVSSQLTVTSPVLDWGPPGTYTTLGDLTVDGSGNVYVVDSQTGIGGKVWKFSFDGVVAGSPYPLQATTPMSGPHGIHYNNGKLFVADSQSVNGGGAGEPRVVVFDATTGAELNAVSIGGANSGSTPRRLTTNFDGSVVYVPIDNKIFAVAVSTGFVTIADGTAGGGFGGISDAQSILVDPSNPALYYVADGSNKRVVHLDLNMNQIRDVIVSPDQSHDIVDIAIDSSGDLYIICKEGSIIYQMVGISDTIRTEYSDSNRILQTTSVVINPTNQVVLGDAQLQWVVTFNQPTVDDTPLIVTTPTKQFGPQGTFTAFQDIAVDAAGNIYVLDSAISQVYKFESDGTPVTTSPYPLQAPTPMAQPYGLGVNDAAEYILVADSQSSSGGGNEQPRLVIFNLADGSYIRAIDITGAPKPSTARKLTSTPDGAVAYVVIADKVYAIPTNGIDPVTSFDGTGGGDPYHGFNYLMSVQIDPSNTNRLYLADGGSHNVVAHLDMTTNTIINTIDNPDPTGCPSSCGNIGDIDFDHHGNLYIASSLGTLIFEMVGVTSTVNTKYAKPGMQIGGLVLNSHDQVIAGDTEINQIYVFNQAQIHGDPQFMGFQQQSFQVHGASHEFFNLFTTLSLQLNSRFMYLATGSCTYNETECWTHPGTYVDQLGLMLPGLTIKLIAGPHSTGMHVMINNETIIPSPHKYHIPITAVSHAQHIDIRYISKGHIVIMTPIISMDIMNSDHFFNLGFSLHSSLSKLLHAGRIKHHIKSDDDLTTFYPDFPLHGLVGQTWRNARYGDKMYQGDITDYMLDDSQLFSTHFTYNLYKQ